MSGQGIVQYILVRGDLMETLKWPMGAVIAQACHAATAVLHQYKDSEDTQAYLEDVDNMHKVVLKVILSMILSQQIKHYLL